MFGEFFRRLAYLLNRRKYDAMLEEEMEVHRGMGGKEQIGNRLLLREEARDAWGWMWLDHLRQDLGYAFRRILEAPGFSLTVMLILAFGIGANLTFFYVLNTAFLRPIQVREPHTLVRLERRSSQLRSSAMPYAAVLRYQKESSVFTDWIAISKRELQWGADPADRAPVVFLTTNYFEQVGYGPSVGRVFTSDDAKPDAPPVAVLSDTFWETRFQRDPGVLNSTIVLSGRKVQVIGVASPDLPGLSFRTTGVFVPIRHLGYFLPGEQNLTAMEDNADVYARLPRGLSLTEARERMRPFVAALHNEFPHRIQKDEFLDVTPGAYRANLNAKSVPILGTVVALALLVLVVACANLGTLMLARAQARRREIAVRLTMGAGRWRIVRQLLTESFVLSCGGAGLSVLLSAWSAKFILEATDAPFRPDLYTDWRILLAVFALICVAMSVFALFPALDVSRQELAAAVKESAAQSTGTRQRGRFRSTLIAAQVTASCVLLILSGLFLRALNRVVAQDPGFDHERVATVDLGLYAAGIKAEESYQYVEAYRRTMEQSPEVAATAVVMVPPLGNWVNTTGFTDLPGFRTFVNSVAPEYFEALNIPILRGRVWTGFPVKDPLEEAVISRSLAQRMYGTIDAVGQPFPKSKPKGTVIAVVEDAHTMQLHAANAGDLYHRLLRHDYERAFVLVRARNNPGFLKPGLIAKASNQDPRVRATVKLLADQFAEQLKYARLTAMVISAVGLLSLFLSCFGLFGVVAYSVASRTREVGIRVALGAARRTILGMFGRQCSRPVALGLVLGCLAAYGLAQALTRVLFGLGALDWQSYAGAILIFAVAAAIACLLPANRASRIDPMKALRHE